MISHVAWPSPGAPGRLFSVDSFAAPHSRAGQVPPDTGHKAPRAPTAPCLALKWSRETVYIPRHLAVTNGTHCLHGRALPRFVRDTSTR